MIAAPCKDCRDRCTYCHGRCERYRAWAEDRRTELALRRMMSEADEVQIEGIYRGRKSKHRKEQKHAKF